MLLLMVQTQLDQEGHLRGEPLLQQGFHGLVHRLAVGRDLGDAGTGEGRAAAGHGGDRPS